MRLLAMLAVLLLTLSVSGCAIFDAAGESVEAVGEGAGHAVSGTGRAISNAADDLDD